MSMAMLMDLTIAGLTRYKDDLWDELVLPTPPVASDIGVEADQLRTAWTINKNDLIGMICRECYGMELTFPDGDYMKWAIGNWSKTHLPVWQRYFETLFYKYNPMWNKDFDITQRVTDAEQKTETVSGNSTDTVTGQTIDSTHPYNSVTTVSAETIDWVNADKRENSGQSQTYSQGQSTTGKQGNENLTRSEKGNIGVTMVQDMIIKERELAMANIYQVIADAFKMAFCIMIY